MEFLPFFLSVSSLVLYTAPNYTMATMVAAVTMVTVSTTYQAQTALFMINICSVQSPSHGKCKYLKYKTT